jgi:hypothetical protein
MEVVNYSTGFGMRSAVQGGSLEQRWYFDI